MVYFNLHSLAILINVYQ